MKIYTTESIRNHDSFTDYIGTDKDAAIESGRTEWTSLSCSDRKHAAIEIREWDIPDDVDLTDEDEVTNAVIEAAGYDIIESFSDKED